MPNGSPLPALPTFQFAQAPDVSKGFDANTIFQLIAQSGAAGQGSLANIAIPPVASILGQQSQFIMPQIEAIRGRGEELAAAAQSDAMRRGLTGSDIEAAGMLGARQEAFRQERELRGQVGMQQAASVAQMLFQALGIDLSANREAFLNLAMALGQEMARQEEIRQFNALLQEGIAAEGRNRLERQQGALIKGGIDIGLPLVKAGITKLFS